MSDIYPQRDLPGCLRFMAETAAGESRFLLVKAAERLELTQKAMAAAEVLIARIQGARMDARTAWLMAQWEKTLNELTKS